MPYIANVLKLFIASPGDVNDERQAIREIVYEWNYTNAENRELVLMPIGWETHSTPSMDDRPQAIINKQVLSNCDLLVAVFWNRLGTPTGEAPSGTVEEIEKHIKSGKPTMIYFSSAPVTLDSVDLEQVQSLKRFKVDCSGRGLVESYSTIIEFKDKFKRHLAQKIIEKFGDISNKSRDSHAGLLSPPTGLHRVEDELPAESKEMLMIASKGDGRILRTPNRGGTNISSRGKIFIETENPREIAKWNFAIEELVKHRFIRPIGTAGNTFDVTQQGFTASERIVADTPKVMETN